TMTDYQFTDSASSGNDFIMGLFAFSRRESSPRHPTPPRSSGISYQPQKIAINHFSARILCKKTKKGKRKVVIQTNHITVSLWMGRRLVQGLLSYSK
ncbi:Unknown protein, partial [Striga hermonthica]